MQSELFANSQGTEESKESTELIEKIHQPNWLSRKFFHRSASSYHLKVKSTSTHKTLKHRKSFAMISKLEPGGRNILLDKSLEEICRLGGTGSLILPDGFGARKRFSLPTCLSATATYLLQHGTSNICNSSCKCFLFCSAVATDGII